MGIEDTYLETHFAWIWALQSSPILAIPIIQSNLRFNLLLKIANNGCRDSFPVAAATVAQWEYRLCVLLEQVVPLRFLCLLYPVFVLYVVVPYQVANSLGLQSTLLGSTLLKGIVDAYITNGLMLVGRPRRMPKKANHGARPNSHVARRAKRPRHV